MENPPPEDDPVPKNAPKPTQRALKRWLARLSSLKAALIILAVTPILTNLAILFLLLSVVPAPPSVNVVAACDKAVHALLTTDSMVELDRSKYLIRSIPCNVRRRLPAASD